MELKERIRDYLKGKWGVGARGAAHGGGSPGRRLGQALCAGVKRGLLGASKSPCAAPPAPERPTRLSFVCCSRPCPSTSAALFLGHSLQGGGEAGGACLEPLGQPVPRPCGLAAPDRHTPGQGPFRPWPAGQRFALGFRGLAPLDPSSRLAGHRGAKAARGGRHFPALPLPCFRAV